MKTFFERWSFKAGSVTEHFACALLTALDGQGLPNAKRLDKIGLAGL